MRWNAPEPMPASFLRWLGDLAGLMGINRREVCLQFAWDSYRKRRRPWEAFQFLANGRWP